MKHSNIQSSQPRNSLPSSKGADRDPNGDVVKPNSGTKIQNKKSDPMPGQNTAGL